MKDLEQIALDVPPDQLSPRDVVTALSERVHGQEYAKRVLALAYQNFHHRYMEHRVSGEDLPKTNVLLPGPTGCGKSLLLAEFARISHLPLVKINLTSTSAEGYVGPSVSDGFAPLMARIGDPYTPFAIVHLDEFDKLVSTGDIDGFGKDLQREIIGYAEDKGILADKLSTRNMLFVATGAFEQLDEVIKRRIGASPSVGFDNDESPSVDDDRILRLVQPRDLREYGLLPELVGRFPRVASLDRLTRTDLRAILDMPSGYLSTQLRVLDTYEDVVVQLDSSARDAIAEHAVRQGTNARALQPAVDIVLEPYFFEASEYQGRPIMLAENDVQAALEPRSATLN